MTSNRSTVNDDIAPSHIRRKVGRGTRAVYVSQGAEGGRF